MAHLIESMMSVREKPWHYAQTAAVTKIIQEAPTSKEALVAAGLDWTVESRPVYMDDGTLIPGWKANVRDMDNKCLGIVTDKYRIVNNAEAFEFTDALIGETEGGVVRYETAGSLRGGKQVWLLAKLPTQKVLDDDVEPYLCFTNTHDGSGALQVCVTPVRVCCANTLALALRDTKRSWSAVHVGDITEKIETARTCLGLADNYMNTLGIAADQYANKTLRMEQIEEILNEMFPVEEDATVRKKSNVKQVKDAFYVAYHMPDIKKFRETAWGAINAMVDMVGHSAPIRKTDTFEENRWGKFIAGHPMINEFVERVNAKVGVNV